MKFIDYYKILGIDKKASEKEIKKAYRKLARKYHPDLNPGDKNAEKKFKEINEANEVLSHAQNRKKYDQYGKDWKHADEFEKAKRQQQSQQQYQRQTYGRQNFSESDFSDFFESMFGGQTTSGRSHQNIQFKGQDFNAELHLNLSDVYKTNKQVLTVNGKNIRLTIPAGIEDGQVIKIKGKGGPGSNGGPSGDLYIRFVINNDTNFVRKGNNLFKTENIDLYTAILGGTTTITTFDGKVKLKIAPGTQNNTKVKLKGKGFPLYKKPGKFGDLIITYNVLIPTNLSDKEKELFQELQKSKH